MENMKSAIAPAAQTDNRVMELALAQKKDEAVNLFVKEAAPRLQKVQEAFAAQVKFQQENVDATYKKSDGSLWQDKMVPAYCRCGFTYSRFSGSLFPDPSFYSQNQ